ncbi:hypothetical protein EIP91_007139 [Steccherinum ochraceum]|uniref:PIH1 N-terminal domain-containing protein n=1 Tax=Steccherinum ochraceum TaxID=92696 RepID=A0A4R0R773_9APHY|nr:hypothetical protein EIP91_007139 [Steccherinum ochraceum]
MSHPALVRVSLAPSPGYCFKSAALSSLLANVSSPPPSPGTLAIQTGVKVFVNVAWDPNVPPPPDASEDAIRRAMLGEEAPPLTRDVSFKDVLKDDGKDEEEWTVPVVVSEPRQDIDKAGNPSIVFDCVYNTSLKSRALRDADFRAFLNELSLQRIERQTTASSVPSPSSPNGLLLSRDIKTPNIASKGKLLKRTVLVPRQLSSVAAEGESRLVEEVSGVVGSEKGRKGGKEEKQAPTPKKGILKTAKAKPGIEDVTRSPSPKPTPAKQPTYTWTQESGKRCLVVDVPDLTRAAHAASTLDVEPGRVVFEAAGLYALDLDLGGGKGQEGEGKKGGEFDVEGARAEWRVREGRLVVFL